MKGLAKVFTGWSWYRPPSKASVVWWRCFWHDTLCRDSSQNVTAMSAYTEEHSTSEKRFLGVVVPAQSTPNPQASLKAALDRLAGHPNTAPFICKQLIQHLVTSNPTPGYVADVVAKFKNDNASVPGTPPTAGTTGARGNLKEVIRAILQHPDARGALPLPVLRPTYGHLRSPVLLVTSTLRWLNATTTAGDALDTEATAMGQNVPSPGTVFSYYLPDEPLPDNSGLLAPEFGIVSTDTLLARANFLNKLLFLNTVPGTTVDLSMIPATQAGTVQWIDDNLMHGTLSGSDSGVKTAITTAIANPAFTADQRKRLALSLAMSSPSYQTER